MNAVANAGTIISDTISILLTGNVEAFSSEVVNMSVVIDPYYQGALTNTTKITQKSITMPVGPPARRA